jgi:hypothetical protein
MELITVASSGDVMITNAAVSPGGRLFGNFPRWTALTEDGVLTLARDGKLRTLIRDDRISGPNEGSLGPDGYYYFPNSQAPRVKRPYEVFKVRP